MCNHWSVVTPEYWYIEPILDDGSGPKEYTRDFVWVEADTRQQAKIEGVRKLRALAKKHPRNSYFGWWIDKDENPFKGLEIKKSQCEHGFCWIDGEECVENSLLWPGEDICPTCELQDRQACIHEWHEGPVQNYNESETTIQKYCWLCSTTWKEYESWI